MNQAYRQMNKQTKHTQRQENKDRQIDQYQQQRPNQTHAQKDTNSDAHKHRPTHQSFLIQSRVGVHTARAPLRPSSPRVAVRFHAIVMSRFRHSQQYQPGVRVTLMTE